MCDSYDEQCLKFAGRIQKIEPSRHISDVWRAIVVISACRLSNVACNASEIAETREERMNFELSQFHNREDALNLCEDLMDFCHVNAGMDVLGTIYSLLSSEDKQKGQYFTPNSISTLVSELTFEPEFVKKEVELSGCVNVLDPTCGSGALLLASAKKFVDSGYDTDRFCLFGQDLDELSALMCYVQMSANHYSGAIYVGDTLEDPAAFCINEKDDISLEEKGKIWLTPEFRRIRKDIKNICGKFGMAVLNPPYSASWSANDKYKDDERFAGFDRLAPKSKADFAFLLHGYHNLAAGGTMAVVLPHGVLFRGAAEEVIRKELLNSGAFYTVIGIPDKMFTSTSIPTCILVMKKGRNEQCVLFIDASGMYEKQKRNVMLPEHVAEVLHLYRERDFVSGKAALVSFDTIQQNDYNLNIPRYVNSFEPEEEIDIGVLADSIARTKVEISRIELNLAEQMSQLVCSDPKDDEDMKKLAFSLMYGNKELDEAETQFLMKIGEI